MIPRPHIDASIDGFHATNEEGFSAMVSAMRRIISEFANNLVRMWAGLLTQVGRIFFSITGL